VWGRYASEHQEAKAVWAIFGSAVGWSFVGTGLYAWRHRPESRTGALMVLLGFGWFLSTLPAANSPLVHTIALLTAGLWGGVFLHLGMSFPSGRLRPGLDRALVIAGYIIFPLATAPALLFSGPEELGCECPENLLLIRRDDELASIGMAFAAFLYGGLFVIVLYRSIRRWRSTPPLERLQLTPVYVCALLTFLLVATARAGAGDTAWWAAFISSALLPFAFLGGLLRSHVSQLDAELRERLEELRASRARLVQAGDAERRRLDPPRTSSCPKRSRTSPSTRVPRTRPSRSGATTGASRSRSRTTASAAPTPPTAPACAGSPTASRRWTARWRSRAPRVTARACAP
jgi:hypothetical protein